MPHSEARVHPFRPEGLQEFDPRLVTGFDPESPTLPENQTTVSVVRNFMYVAGQHEDMLAAYRYAEQKILLEIRERGIANLVPGDVKRWFMEIHERIAFTLASELPDVPLAGHFVPDIVIRWKKTSQEGPFFALLLLLHPRASAVDDFDGALLRLGQSFNFDGALLSNFIQFSKQFQADNSQENFELLLMVLAMSLGFNVDAEENQGYLEKAWSFYQILIKYHDFSQKPAMFYVGLSDAYHDRKFSQDERAIVESMVKICLRPKDMPAAMEKFSEEVLVKWQACNPDDLTAVAGLAAYEFYEETEGHFVWNANGRAATCLMNVILRSLDQPSILLRNPGERDDPNSLYSRAIAAIAASDPDLDLLTQHIRTRLEEASQPQKEPNADECKAVEMVKSRVELARLFAQALDQGVDEQHLSKAMWETQARCIGNKKDVTNDDLLEISQALRAMVMTNYLQPTAPSAAAATPGPVQSTNTVIERDEILEKLRALTGVTEGWEVYQQGKTFLLTLAAGEQDDARDLKAKLNTTNALTAVSMKLKGADTPVVKITNVNLERLRDVQVAADSAGSKAEAVDLPQPGSRTS